MVQECIAMWLWNLDYLVDVIELHDFTIDPLCLLVLRDGDVYMVYDTVHDIYGIGYSLDEAIEDFKDNSVYSEYLVFKSR